MGQITSFVTDDYIDNSPTVGIIFYVQHVRTTSVCSY